VQGLEPPIVDALQPKIRFPLSLWLPVMAMLLSAAIVLIPAFRLYRHWKAILGTGDKLILTTGTFQAILPRERMPRSALEMAALREQDTICLLNAPGHLVGAFFSNVFTHRANWFPDLLGPFIWRVFSYPLFAIPAWFFAGRGIDGLLLRRHMRIADLIAGIILAVLSLGLSAGLRFGLSESERAGDELLIYYIYGFAWWTLLFSFPWAGWMRERFRTQ
jgi:hypothetical protein